jgi:hypothetical protein
MHLTAALMALTTATLATIQHLGARWIAVKLLALVGAVGCCYSGMVMWGALLQQHQRLAAAAAAQGCEVPWWHLYGRQPASPEVVAQTLRSLTSK